MKSESVAPPEPLRAGLGGVVARGGMLLGAGSLVENAAQFLRALVLARILSPKEFGLMGMAFVVAQAVESVSQTGFYNFLVQRRGDSEGHLDTVWTISVLRGFAIFGALWLFAPLVGQFFATPAAVPVVRGVALSFAIHGFINPAICLLERDFRFMGYMTPFVVGTIVELFASVLLALLLRSVWAMVWGLAVGRAVAVVVSFMVRAYVPRPRIIWGQVMEMYRYGRHINRSAAVEYIVSQLDKAFVGRMMGVDSLGLYSFASRLASFPTSVTSKGVIGVAFPVFVRFQDDAERLKSGFLRAVGLMSAVAAPIAAGLLIVSADLVPIVIGERWSDMVPALRILCTGGACVALQQLTVSILRGVGRPEVGAHASYLMLAVVAAILYPAVRLHGITGAAWCMALGSFVAMAYLLIVGARATGCGMKEIARALSPSVLGSFGMVVAIMPARSWSAMPPTAWLLAGECVAGAAVYVALAVSLDRSLKSGIVQSFRSMWRAA